MRTTRPDGVELWWELVGRETGPGRASAPPVMLVPGRGDATDLFPPELVDPLVAAGHPVIRFDPRDTGLSGDGGDQYTMATMVDDAVAVLDEVAGAGTAAHWVGISMGGLQLIDLATRCPDRVLSLTFVSAMSPDPDAGFGDHFFAPPDDDPVEGWLRAMGEVESDDRVWAADRLTQAEDRAPSRPEAADRHMAAAMRLGWPTPDDLSPIGAPTLVVHGTADQTLPVAHADALAGGISGARLLLRPGMGHLPRRHDWAAIADAIVALAAVDLANPDRG